MRFELDLKFSSFSYPFDESAMCAGLGGWKPGCSSFLHGITSPFPLFREIMFIIEYSKKLY